MIMPGVHEMQMDSLEAQLQWRSQEFATGDA